MPRAADMGGFDLAGIATLVLVLAVVLLPVLFARRPAPPGGSPPADAGGDGGIGPRPSGPPAGPAGGMPLPGAEPGRWRLRDHPGPRRRLARARRGAREPVRDPSRTAVR